MATYSELVTCSVVFSVLDQKQPTYVIDMVPQKISSLSASDHIKTLNLTRHGPD